MTPTEAITALEKALEAYETATTGKQEAHAIGALMTAANPDVLRTLLDAHAGALRDAERYRLIRAGYVVMELLTPEARPEEGLNYRSATIKAELNYGDPGEGAALDAFIDRAALTTNTKGA